MIRIICMGDSTMQYNDCTTFPQTGWVQALPRYLPKDSVIENFAKNGRSTKSFIAEGRFAEALNAVKSGDYVLIEFGHNDEKMEDANRGTLPNGEYKDNLSLFVREVRAKGAKPILLSSIARRKFTAEGKVEKTHGEYPMAVKAVAEESGVPFIDMDSLTRAMLEKVGEEKSRAFFMNFDADLYPIYPEGKSDNTHLRYDGAFMVASVAAAEFMKLSGEYSSLANAIIALPKGQAEMLSKLPEEP